MALEIKELTKLAKTVAKADPKKPTAYSFGENNFSYSELNEALREEFKELAPNFRTYKINQNTIFQIMEETIEDVLPAKVMQMYAQFAEVKTFPQGKKPLFTQKITTASRNRAKQFIGKVGLAGMYEVFKLDGKSYEVTTNAIGGAAQIGFEEFLDGNVDFADVLNIVLEGLDECIYIEIAEQLAGAAKILKDNSSANYMEGNGFNETALDKLVSIARSYAQPTIYCSYDFAQKICPATMSDNMIDKKWENGYLGNYKGIQVVVLPQSYENDNKQKVIDPSYCYIIPTGADKPVKIAFEGGAIVDEYVNADRSREVQIYKKVGVRAVFSPAICVFRDTGLTR